MDSAEEIFKAARDKFVRRLSSDEKRKFENAKLNDLKAVIDGIQRGQEDTRQLMDAYRLHDFIDRMEQFSKVMDLFVISAPYLSYIWGAMRFLLSTARTVSDSFNLLLDAYKDLGVG